MAAPWRQSLQAGMPGVRREAILDAYQILLSVLLFVSPWLFAYAHGSAATEDWSMAILVSACSFAALVIFREWEEWINFVLGVWILASPWVLGFQDTAAMKVNLVVGGLIAYLAILELWLIHYGPPSRPIG
jgi:hypothetical protein